MPSANGSNGNGADHGSNGHSPPPALPEPEKLPDLWDEAQVSAILLQVSDGKGLRDACLDVGIKRSTFAMWVIEDVRGLADRFARARALQISAMECEILAIADDSRNDTETRRDASGREYDVPDHEWIARTKLRVDTRKWIMSKVAPKQYGERNETALTVGGGARPVIIEINPNRRHQEQMDERRVNGESEVIQLANAAEDEPRARADA